MTLPLLLLLLSYSSLMRPVEALGPPASGCTEVYPGLYSAQFTAMTLTTSYGLKVNVLNGYSTNLGNMEYIIAIPYNDSYSLSYTIQIEGPMNGTGGTGLGSYWLGDDATLHEGFCYPVSGTDQSISLTTDVNSSYQHDTPDAQTVEWQTWQNCCVPSSTYCGSCYSTVTYGIFWCSQGENPCTYPGSLPTVNATTTTVTSTTTLVSTTTAPAVTATVTATSIQPSTTTTTSLVTTTVSALSVTTVGVPPTTTATNSTSSSTTMAAGEFPQNLVAVVAAVALGATVIMVGRSTSPRRVASRSTGSHQHV
jgi:hypothetical protein